MPYVHKIEEFPNEARLDELSRDNWEPVLAAGNRVIFRKPVPIEAASPARFIPENESPQARERLDTTGKKRPGR